MSFLAKVKHKVKRALGKLSSSRFRTPGRGGRAKLAKCLHCDSAWTRDPIQLCHDCKWIPYVNGPFLLDDEEEGRKGGDKGGEAGEGSGGEGKGAADPGFGLED